MVLVVLGVLPLPSAAHLVSTGLGPIYDGIGHFFLSLEDLLPLLALMTLGGLNGVAAGRRIMFVLPSAWLIGGILGSLIAVGTTVPAYVAPLMAIMLGVMVATDAQLPERVLTGVIGIVGSASGLTTGIALATQTNNLQLILGSAIALCVLATAVPALVIVAATSRPWMRIAVRVLGSWIAGAGLLMLGWQVRIS